MEEPFAELVRRLVTTTDLADARAVLEEYWVTLSMDLVHAIG